MIRLSNAEARLLFPELASDVKTRSGNKRRREDLPENQIAAQICDFLRASGWTVTRQQSGKFMAPYSERWVPVGEKGLADYRAERPRPELGYGIHEMFYYETKAPGRKPSRVQELWLEQRSATGTPAEWFDGYDAGRRKFATWYGERFGYR